MQDPFIKKIEPVHDLLFPLLKSRQLNNQPCSDWPLFLSEPQLKAGLEIDY